MVEKSLDDDKAEDIVVIDLHGKSSMADFMVIASGRSQRQLHAMAEHLQAKLKEQGVTEVGIEGARVGDRASVQAGGPPLLQPREDVGHRAARTGAPGRNGLTPTAHPRRTDRLAPQRRERGVVVVSSSQPEASRLTAES